MQLTFEDESRLKPELRGKPIYLIGALDGEKLDMAYYVAGVFSTALAYVLYFRLIAKTGGARTLSVTYLIPLVANLIGVQLLGDEDEAEEGEAEQKGLMAAVRTILIADIVMSLDNVIAVAAAAKGSTPLLIIGLAISIPLVVFGSTLMIKMMERYPIIITLGAALIGWVGGETMISDVALKEVVEDNPALHYVAAAAGAILVVLVGKYMGRKGGNDNEPHGA